MQKEVLAMKRKYWLLLSVCAVLLIISLAKADDGFYVIAGGGKSGKVLKTQVFTSTTLDSTVGTDSWARLTTVQWNYTKLSSTSYLVITYQDTLSARFIWVSYYQLRVDDQPSVAGPNGALLSCIQDAVGSYSATGVWTGLSKGDHTLSIWHRVVPNNLGETLCQQNWPSNTTSVIVMEIES
jgi:hypothetical protein